MPRYAGADLLQKFATYENILASADADSAGSRHASEPEQQGGALAPIQEQQAAPQEQPASPASSCGSGGGSPGAGGLPGSRPSSAGSSRLPEALLLNPQQLQAKLGREPQQQQQEEGQEPEAAAGSGLGQGRQRRASSPEIRTPARQPSALGGARASKLRASSEDEREVQQQPWGLGGPAQQGPAQQQQQQQLEASFQPSPVSNATPGGVPCCEAAKQLFRDGAAAGAGQGQRPGADQDDVEQQQQQAQQQQAQQQQAQQQQAQLCEYDEVLEQPSSAARRRSGSLVSRTLSSIGGLVKLMKPAGGPAAAGSPVGSDSWPQIPPPQAQAQPLPAAARALGAQLFGRRRSQGRLAGSAWPEFDDEEAGRLPSVAPLAARDQAAGQQGQEGWGQLWQFAGQEQGAQGEQEVWRFADRSLAASSDGGEEPRGPGAWGAAPAAQDWQQQQAEVQQGGPDAAMVQLGRQYVLQQHQRDVTRREQQLQQQQQGGAQRRSDGGAAARPGSDLLLGYSSAAAPASSASSPDLAAARGDRSLGVPEADDSDDELQEVLQLPSGWPPPAAACMAARPPLPLCFSCPLPALPLTLTPRLPRVAPPLQGRWRRRWRPCPGSRQQGDTLLLNSGRRSRWTHERASLACREPGGM
jgi:hypothetical protein